MALKRVKYVGRYPEVEFQHPTSQAWVTVQQGGTVDLPTRAADALAEQADNWEIVNTAKAAKEEGEG